jgi:adenylate cyclase
MANERVERRLTAIFAGDVVGYSRLMGADEEGTLARLNAHRREFLDPKIAEHRGRIVKRTGDGILIEFASAVDAARCAVDIQRGMSERNAAVSPDKRIELRIGINVGDIIIEDEDIFGDGVNIAARLEGIAEPGGVCISEDAYRQVRDRLDAAFEDGGEQQLKNIARPVRIYRLRPSGGAVIAPQMSHLPLPDRPSIAVLPFQNMSGDPEQEYFADGMVEDIITALSRFRQLFVIARNSSFTYKGRAVDVKQVGRELGVRYVLEGSVRKATNRVRITGQLIDTATGAHLWADRFDGALEDVFDLQDRVTTSVVGAIAPKLEEAEIERTKRKPTENLDAYDYYLRALACFRHITRESMREALRLCDKAIEHDPEFAAAYGMAAWCYVPMRTNGWSIDRTQEVAAATRMAEKAAEFGKDDAVALCGAGWAMANFVGDLDKGAALMERARSINPNLAAAWVGSGWISVRLGEPEVGLERLKHAMRLSPFDPIIFVVYGATAAGHFFAGRYDEAASWAEKATREQPNYATAPRFAAASYALAGRADEAAKSIAHLSRIDPAARISNLKDWITLRRAEDIARLEQGLRKAGLPE